MTWFHSGFLEVRLAVVMGEVTTPKNHKIRRIDMSPLLAQTLQRLKEIRELEVMAKGTAVPEWVFLSPEGDTRGLFVTNKTSRGFAVSAAAMSFTFGAFFASIVLLPLWLQINMGYTSTWAGYVLAFQAVFGVIMAPIAAILMTRFDPRILMSLGLVILASAILYRTSYALNVSFETMILPQLAMGFGIPLFFVPLMTLSMTSVRPEETAAA